MIFIHQAEIIEVSADAFGRSHRRVNVKFPSVRKGRKDPREHLRLDLGCHIQLGADPLLLRRYMAQVSDIPVYVHFHLP